MLWAKLPNFEEKNKHMCANNVVDFSFVYSAMIPFFESLSKIIFRHTLARSLAWNTHAVKLFQECGAVKIIRDALSTATFFVWVHY